MKKMSSQRDLLSAADPGPVIDRRIHNQRIGSSTSLRSKASLESGSSRHSITGSNHRTLKKKDSFDAAGRDSITSSSSSSHHRDLSSSGHPPPLRRRTSSSGGTATSTTNTTKASKQGQQKSKTMGTGSRHSKSEQSSKLKPQVGALQNLVESIYDLKPHVDLSSPEAVRALKHVEKAIDQMEKRLETLPNQVIEEKPQQSLSIRYTLFVDEPTPEAETHPEVFLARATYQANAPSEDRSTVVVGEDFIFAGVWDGHGGTFAADFTQTNLFPNFQKAYENGATVSQAFTHAYTQTDRSYYYHAKNVNKPQVFFAGTCAVSCFVDIKTGLVTCANLGDSRAVMGIYKDGQTKVVALSVDHSADNPTEQARIRAEHPDDAEVVLDMDETGEDPDWRVKKIAGFTRSIGDLHLKEKNTSALFNSYVPPHQRILPRPGLKCLKTGITKPKYISTEPEIKEATVKDGFIIIACDGVWDEMSSEEAVKIVACLLSQYDPEETNIAELFIDETLKRAVHRISSTYDDEEHLTLRELKSRPPGKASGSHRSMLHDDITVCILQFGRRKRVVQKHVGGSLFNLLQNDAQTRRAASDDTEMLGHIEDQSLMSMSRTKAKREMAVRSSMLDWLKAIELLQDDAKREATDNQIIEMMNAFDDMEARHLRILFNAVDVDGNGSLDREEITRLIRNVIQMDDVSPDVVALAFSEMDADGSGDVDFDEFIQFFGH